MRYKLRCRHCGATQWVRGEDDPETNSFAHVDPVTDEWDGDSPDCDHPDTEWEVIDQEHDDSYAEDNAI